MDGHGGFKGTNGSELRFMAQIIDDPSPRIVIRIRDSMIWVSFFMFLAFGCGGPRSFVAQGKSDPFKGMVLGTLSCTV